MIFLDINTFYGPKAGGIRTYHDAKIAAFSRQDEHLYVLIHPGPVARVERPAPSVMIVQVPGIALTADPQGYRLLLNYLPVARWIRRLRPDVIEAGDAWLTAWFCLLLRPLGLWQGLRVSFYHSDPVPTYFEPWARKGGVFGGVLRRVLSSWASTLFYRVQSRFDHTAVASRGLGEALRRRGVGGVKHLPFGAHPAYFAAATPAIALRRGGHGEEPVRFLYAGRLDADKDAGLLLEILPALLEDTRVTVTVAGRGALAGSFAAFSHPRYRFAGFVEGLEGMAALYAAHDVLLAPGPYETFGMAVLEALAAGLAVVGPDAGGAAELLREAGSPFIFSAGSATSFLEKARAAARADAATLAETCARGRAAATRYGTWDDAVARMIAAWKEAAR